MDRFIDIDNCEYFTHKLCLKSNMDRFIDTRFGLVQIPVELFKIQYG